MKTELPCAVVRDLLPSYTEGLTEEETSAAVRAHLEQCGSCRSRWEAMREAEASPAAAEREVDFLKAVRKRNIRRVILSILLAAAVVIGAVGAMLFLIGTPADRYSVAMEVTEYAELNSITVSFMNPNSAAVLTGLKLRTEGDVAEITARQVLVSPIHPAEEAALSLNLAGIREVRAFGKTIWQEGVVVDQYTHGLMERKTAYVGDAPAVDALICRMDLDAPHWLELQTTREPYGVTIHFTKQIEENRRFMVEGHAYVLLALVENLGEVRWDDPSGYVGALTLTEADAALPELVSAYNEAHSAELVPLSGVKDYGADACRLQLLRNFLGI